VILEVVVVIRILFAVSFLLISSLVCSAISIDFGYLPWSDSGVSPTLPQITTIPLELPDTLPDFFDSVWIAAYNDAISKEMDEESAQTKAYSAWREFKTDPIVFAMSKPMQEAFDAANQKGKEHIIIAKASQIIKVRMLKVMGKAEGSKGYELRVGVKFNGYNGHQVANDIIAKSWVISYLHLSPEEILQIYDVPQNMVDYIVLLSWLDSYLYRITQEVTDRRKDDLWFKYI
jgi:hypothetical protein